MKTQLGTSPLLKIGALLLLFCAGLSTAAVACIDPILGIRPGENSFADAIESNPGLEYEIETKLTVNLVGTKYTTFCYQELTFKDVGIKLRSKEMKGEKWRPRKSKTGIVDVRFEKPAEVADRMMLLLPELSKVAFPDESPKAVEKGFGVPSYKSKSSLEFADLGCRFYFYSSKDSKKMDRIRLLHWSAAEESN